MLILEWKDILDDQAHIFQDTYISKVFKWVIVNYAMSHNKPQRTTTTHNEPQRATKNHDHPQQTTTSHNKPQ